PQAAIAAAQFSSMKRPIKQLSKQQLNQYYAAFQGVHPCNQQLAVPQASRAQ
ncbi:hypothetical protein Dimus_016357, partial [Dionaea muscipula]